MFRLTLTVAACVLAMSWQASRAAETYDINIVLPLSGPAAFIGQTHDKALHVLELIANKNGGINGRPVHFVFSDDQTSPQIAVQLATSLIAEKPPVVLGSNLSAMCRAMAPLFKDGPVQYCLSPRFIRRRVPTPSPIASAPRISWLRPCASFVTRAGRDLLRCFRPTLPARMAVTRSPLPSLCPEAKDFSSSIPSASTRPISA